MRSRSLHSGFNPFWSHGEHRYKQFACAPWAATPLHQVLNHQFKLWPQLCSPAKLNSTASCNNINSEYIHDTLLLFWFFLNPLYSSWSKQLCIIATSLVCCILESFQMDPSLWFPLKGKGWHWHWFSWRGRRFKKNIYLDIFQLLLVFLCTTRIQQQLYPYSQSLEDCTDWITKSTLLLVSWGSLTDNCIN